MMLGRGYGRGGMLGRCLWGIVLVIGIVALVLYLIRNRQEDPITTLKKRYANGDISKKEFEQMKKKLL